MNRFGPIGPPLLGYGAGLAGVACLCLAWFTLRRGGLFWAGREVTRAAEPRLFWPLVGLMTVLGVALLAIASTQYGPERA